ncbi:MAG: hypothetical protein OEM97_02140 [Acidimicrobiia bacterium]|nr:hypothetical protein [Acidimicrobiia bacterium]
MDSKPALIHFDVPHGDREQHASLMERLGHPSTVCHGPGNEGICPILEEEGQCPLINEAHGVVFEFDLDTDRHREILTRYLEVIDPDVPVRVVVEPEVYERHKDLLQGVEVWNHEPTVGELDGFAARVEAADKAREDDTGS